MIMNVIFAVKNNKYNCDKSQLTSLWMGTSLLEIWNAGWEFTKLFKQIFIIFRNFYMLFTKQLYIENQ